jgi:hypothetical protein
MRRVLWPLMTAVAVPALGQAIVLQTVLDRHTAAPGETVHGVLRIIWNAPGMERPAVGVASLAFKLQMLATEGGSGTWQSPLGDAAERPTDSIDPVSHPDATPWETGRRPAIYRGAGSSGFGFRHPGNNRRSLVYLVNAYGDLSGDFYPPSDPGFDEGVLAAQNSYANDPDGYIRGEPAAGSLAFDYFKFTFVTPADGPFHIVIRPLLLQAHYDPGDGGPPASFAERLVVGDDIVSVPSPGLIVLAIAPPWMMRRSRSQARARLHS